MNDALGFALKEVLDMPFKKAFNEALNMAFKKALDEHSRRPFNEVPDKLTRRLLILPLRRFLIGSQGS